MIATDGKIEVVDGKHIQEVTRQFPFESGQTFSLTNVNGKITVTGWDKEEVLITAEKRLERRVGGLGWIMSKLNIDFKTSDDMEAYFQKVDVVVSTNENGVEIETIRPRRGISVNVSVHYDVKLPRESSVTLITSNGTITIENILGDVSLRSSNGRLIGNNIVGPTKARTSNGSVNLVDITGAIQAKTSNGTITIEHPVSLSSDDAITCSTSNGSVRIYLAEDSAFDIEARTSNGRIRSDFEIDREDDGKNRRRLRGRVGDGGALLDLSTTNGSITINQL